MKVQERGAAIVLGIVIPTTRNSRHTTTRPRITARGSVIAICISGIFGLHSSTAMTQRIRVTTTATTTVTGTVTVIETAIATAIETGTATAITKDIAAVTGIVTGSLADRLNYARRP